MRGGMYWSGDLAYRDADGFVYFAGRTADWLRVDGENLAAAPIERVLLRHPAVSEAAVYAVPDESVGDQVMAALVLTRPARPGRARGVPGRPARPRDQAWPRHVRSPRPSADRHQQGAQAGARRPGLDVTDARTRAERGTRLLRREPGPPISSAASEGRVCGGSDSRAAGASQEVSTWPHGLRRGGVLHLLRPGHAHAATTPATSDSALRRSSGRLSAAAASRPRWSADHVEAGVAVGVPDLRCSTSQAGCDIA